MSAAGVTKASTLECCARSAASPREDVVAFGDMPNDVAMLEWAGTSYAMANAHPRAMAAATTPPPATTRTVSPKSWRSCSSRDAGPRCGQQGRAGAGARRPVVAIDGVDGAGKTTFAGCWPRCCARGRDVVQAPIDGFHHPLAHRRAEGRTPEAVWEPHFDLVALAGSSSTLAVRSAGTYRTAVHYVVTDECLVLPQHGAGRGRAGVDGLFRQRPELDGCWHCGGLPRRARSRCRWPGWPLGTARRPTWTNPDQRRYGDAQRIYFRTCDPRGRADLVIDNR